MGKIKLFVLGFLVLLSQAFLSNWTSLAETSPTTRVEILDDALASAIRTELGLAVDAVITDSDMEALTQLDASGMGIEDLTGLEKAANLQTLDLSVNNIIDVRPLEGLQNITALNLSQNRIYDLSPLMTISEAVLDIEISANNQLIEIETVQQVTDGTLEYPFLAESIGGYPTFSSASDGGTYNPDTNTVTWTGLSGEGTVDYTWNDVVAVTPPKLVSYYSFSGTVKIPYQEAAVFGEVVVQYQDTNGATLAESTKITGEVGAPYHLEAQAITGYTFKEFQGNPEGVYTNDVQTVRFIYTADTGLPHTDDSNDSARVRTVAGLLFSLSFVIIVAIRRRPQYLNR